MSWRKPVGWALAMIAGFIVIGAVAGCIYLQSNGFREFALRKIVEQVDQSTGGRTEIRALDFNLPTLTAHLYGIVIHGKEKFDSPPLLEIDKLTVGLKIQSVLRRQISLSELLIEHPVAHIWVDRTGESNLPQSPPSNSNGPTNIFDLAVGHLALSGGEIVYNDRKTPLEADLHDLKTDVKFEFLATRYRGSISYDNGHLRYDKYSPLTHGLNASFTATRSFLTLDSAVLTIASSTVKLAAEMTNYSDPAISGSYGIDLHSEDFAEISPAVGPAGNITLSGKFHYQHTNDQPLLKDISVDGGMSSRLVAAVVSGGHLEIRNLKGQYQLANGSLRASGIEADFLGGRVQVNLDVEHLDATPTSRVQAALRSISLGSAQHAFRRPELNPVTITGSVDGTANAEWTGSITNARGRVDVTIRNPDGKESASLSATNLPIDAAIHATYDGPTNTLGFHQTTIRIPTTSLTAEGQISKRSHVELHADTSDLHRVAALLSAILPAGKEVPAVTGSATVDATVQGSLRTPQISAHVTGRDIQMQGSEWKNADLSIRADRSQIVVSNASLINVRGGQASFDGTIALNNWSYLPSSPIQTHLSLHQMQIADLQHLANVRYPVSGELSAKISLSGTQLDPRGSGSVEIVNAHAYDEPIKAVKLSFHGENGSVVSELHISADAGSANANLTYVPRTKAYTIRLDAPAIVLQKLKTVQEQNLALQGTAAISANGHGTLDDPQITASIQLPRLEIKQNAIAGLKADIQVANRRAEFNVDSQISQASVHARGHVDLSGNYQADASIDTSVVPLNVLLATYSGRALDGFSGEMEVHAAVKGPLKNISELEAHLVIPTLTASYQSLQVGAAGPIRADYSHSVLTLQPSEIRGTGTSLRVQGSIPIGGTTAPNLTAQGSMDARIFRIFSPDLRSSGTIALDIRATGAAANPQVAGQLRLQNVAFTTAAAPLGIDKLNGTLDIDNQRVQISNLTGEVGGGRVSAGGSITYRPRAQFDIAVQAESVRLRYPDGLRSILDANLAWAGNQDASTLRGRVLVDALSFTPDFDFATFGDQFNSQTAAPTAPGFADNISLQVAIQSKENLSAANSQVSLEGSASLHATGSVANPIVTGRADLTAGELFYRNVRYQLQRGIITLADPNETAPTLDVSVSTTVEQYNLTLTLRGPFDMLTTSYSSEPPLATADIINLIARGKTSSELAASGQSTDSMIAAQAASQFSGSVQKLAGISSLQIDPTFGGNQNPSTRVGVQQRVTKNFLFTFSTDVSEPGAEIVQGEYQINKRWSVSVARDQLGGVSMDGRFHTKF
jgi:translocation and assembly module TamB